MGYMFLGASAFDQDLGWCVDDDVSLDSAFYATSCASTSCGVDVQGTSCPVPTPRPTTPLPTTQLPSPRPTPAPTPATSDAVEGSITCSDISLADAEANAHVYVSAVADLYAVAASKVIVTFHLAGDASRVVVLSSTTWSSTTRQPQPERRPTPRQATRPPISA